LWWCLQEQSSRDRKHTLRWIQVRVRPALAGILRDRSSTEPATCIHPILNMCVFLYLRYSVYRVCFCDSLGANYLLATFAHCV
jgi:hypothetical protein